MWSSWYLCGTPFNRILIDSSASTIQTSIFGLVFPNTAASVLAAIYWCFTMALLLVSEFPTFHFFSTSVVHCMFKFFIIGFNEKRYHVIGLASSSFGFLDSPLFLRFDFRCIRHEFVCFLVSLLTPTMYIRQVAFRSIKYISWSLSMHLIILDLHPHSSNHQYVSPTIHLMMYVYFW